MDINVPVTLVIRAPNQRIEDHTVECMLGWTVKKLKKHLEVVYPSNPKETQQRLIYSGKLLADEMTLKDIIIQNEERLHHTVHLVCSPSVDNSFIESRNHPEKSVNSNISSTYTTSNVHSSEGLRHRLHQDQTSQPSTTASFGSTNSTSQPPPMMMPNSPGVALTPEQYMMMMQNYYYQMNTQYMQYYQTGTYQPMNGSVVSEQETEAPRENVQQAPAARPDNANLVMNAQGGMEDDDDDEFGQRDWLDYVYTFSRFLVLISIVYFYSNFTRFLAVAAFFFLVYLYQTGWFNVRRRNPEPENEDNPAQEQPQQTENTPRDPETEENSHRTEEDPERNEENSDRTEEERNTPQTDNTTETEEPPPPGALAVAWCFVSTFFSSLIPEPPAPINAN
ncbi:homocysteine-responsive endoplasmic reticulum-resident ubiquitin-like domain member 2 protein [Ostrea edulis]|uniref:homocysteine-responsive endoplasmic reticulum-resident ubiquitin-like domain member 2 protein n=1 Tax=Ostrea edulis TaxID=37623 RepID=UPI0024AF74BD|nr:homocysteine-responsive endoplasmic reticulum-resident ubiquitin-like domain member 2 protein [Ostrea edulis]XP_048752905.2 homocysteine-responsive endoplasmic reticulum-resident ubiquitin-like domain member 2 protein [Ostrea edulis]XP_048752906.2 homocysteine-responsive endoplasmic reticulum-resident ubiquitin-like domain member 2 protein [Ostrea edulis]